MRTNVCWHIEGHRQKEQDPDPDLGLDSDPDQEPYPKMDPDPLVRDMILILYQKATDLGQHK
jgi:hypothetical protein